MFDSPIFDTVFGIVIVYVVLSIVVSAIQECAAGLLQLRSKTLKRGIENLIGEDHATLLYDHGLVRGLSRKRAGWIDRVINGGKPRAPSNIPPATFGIALTDILTEASAETTPTLDDVRHRVSRIADEDLQSALTALLRQTDFDIEDFRKRVARWFEDAMDRVQGWYARKARLWSLCVAAVLVVGLNADTLNIGNVLWENENLRARLIALAPKSVTPAALDLDKAFAAIPLGWPCPKARRKAGESFCVFAREGDESMSGPVPLPRLIGWLLTIFAISLGAPFWFDLMNRLANLRSAGRSPDRADSVKG
jgi:hypothetical protein